MTVTSDAFSPSASVADATGNGSGSGGADRSYTRTCTASPHAETIPSGYVSEGTSHPNQSTDRPNVTSRVCVRERSSPRAPKRRVAYARGFFSGTFLVTAFAPRSAPRPASAATQSVSPRAASTVATGMPAHRTRHATGEHARSASRVAGASGSDRAVETVTANGSMADARPGGRNGCFSFSVATRSASSSSSSSNGSRLTVIVADANPRSASGIGAAGAPKMARAPPSASASDAAPNVAVAERREPSIRLASSTSAAETIGAPRSGAAFSSSSAGPFVSPSVPASRSASPLSSPGTTNGASRVIVNATRGLAAYARIVCSVTASSCPLSGPSHFTAHAAPLFLVAGTLNASQACSASSGSTYAKVRD